MFSADAPICARCNSDQVNTKVKHPTMPYHYRDCRKCFLVKIGTPMQLSNMGYQQWAIAFYMMTTGIKGVSSMKLHRDLGIRQATAWHMGHRIREVWDDRPKQFNGPVESDTMFVGGKEGNKHASKRLNLGGGTGCKTRIVGMRDRQTGLIEAEVLEDSTAETMRGFVTKRTRTGTKVYTDTGTEFAGLVDYDREVVNHTAGEYVKGEAHTNSIESFWAMFKRGHKGTYHKMSFKHLHRYVNEFVGRFNDRNNDTIYQMEYMVSGMAGKRLKYNDLVA